MGSGDRNFLWAGDLLLYVQIATLAHFYDKVEWSERLKATFEPENLWIVFEIEEALTKGAAVQ